MLFWSSMGLLPLITAHIARTGIPCRVADLYFGRHCSFVFVFADYFLIHRAQTSASSSDRTDNWSLSTLTFAG